MITLKTTTRLLRIAGQQITVERNSDGIQRSESLVDHTGELGYAHKNKWQPQVTAYAGSEKKTFAVFQYGMTTEQAFTAARLWIVATAKEIAA